jgi:hypothetical protein
MLTFLTSLRHPANAVDYRRVGELLARTLRSVTAQRNDAFEVVVVGNLKPDIEWPNRVRFVQADFPPPEVAKTTGMSREAVGRDKGTKLAVAMLAADPATTHFMTLDADDLVSNRLAGYVASQPVHSSPGWVIDCGYMFHAPATIAPVRSGFNEVCGTSLIFDRSTIDVPDLPTGSSQQEIIRGFGYRVIFDLLGSHKHLRKHYEEAGRPLEVLPFPGAAYAVGTGENWWGATMPRIGRPLTASIADEFSIPRSSLRRGFVDSVKLDVPLVVRNVARRVKGSPGTF